MIALPSPAMSVSAAAMLATGIGLGTAAEISPWAVKPTIPAAQQLFPQGAVRLLDGPFKAMQEVDHAYLLRLEPDRLLAQFRVEAGRGCHAGGNEERYHQDYPSFHSLFLLFEE